MVIIVASSKFKKSIKHLDSRQREKIKKMIEKILKDPSVGKPLKYFRGERCLRVKPFRIIYAFRKDKNTLYLLKFEHRDSVYSK